MDFIALEFMLHSNSTFKGANNGFLHEKAQTCVYYHQNAHERWKVDLLQKAVDQVLTHK